MSDDHKDRFPKLSDGVSPDWRTWLQRVMPELYGKTSAAYPDKNLYQVLEMVPPHERGPLVTSLEEQVEIPRMYPDKEGNPNNLNGTPMVDGRGDPVVDYQMVPRQVTQEDEDFRRECAARVCSLLHLAR